MRIGSSLVILCLAACAGGNRDTPEMIPNDLATAITDLGATSADLSSVDADPSIQVVINEVNPNGADEATDPDWVEIMNIGTTTADLSGYQVRDDKQADLTSLPMGTLLPAGGYLVLYCDDRVDGGAVGGVHLPFKLSGGSGDEFHLLTASGASVDMVTFGASAVPAMKTYGRLPNGSGAFSVTTPTPNAANMP